MPHRILVTGARVAGNTLSFWRARHWHDVTVVERAPEFRDGGQNVDVRGRGREVLRCMGLEAQALSRGAGEEATASAGEGGRVAACVALDALREAGQRRDPRSGGTSSW